jgi:hypothetical protein
MNAKPPGAVAPIESARLIGIAPLACTSALPMTEVEALSPTMLAAREIGVLSVAALVSCTTM